MSLNRIELHACVCCCGHLAEAMHLKHVMLSMSNLDVVFLALASSSFTPVTATSRHDFHLRLCALASASWPLSILIDKLNPHSPAMRSAVSTGSVRGPSSNKNKFLGACQLII